MCAEWWQSCRLLLSSLSLFLIPNREHFTFCRIPDTDWISAIAAFSICDTGPGLILTRENNCSIEINSSKTQEWFSKNFPDIFSKCWGIKLTSFLGEDFCQTQTDMFAHVHNLESERISSHRGGHDPSREPPWMSHPSPESFSLEMESSGNNE